MKKFTGNLSKKDVVLLWVISLLLVSFNVHAATTVTVDNNNKVIVTQQGGVVETAVVPVVVTTQTAIGNFEGRVVEIDYLRYQMVVQNNYGVNRNVMVRPEMINSYRVGDYVLIRPTPEITVITLQENPKDFEGEIIRVDMSENQIIVLDTNGRERRVQMKQGMIATYKVDDYVRIHLMEDLKEAKTIETIRGIRHIEGNIVSVDVPTSRIVVRNSDGSSNTVWIRQGYIQNYRAGNRVRVYLLENREQVQVIRIIQQ